MRGIARPAREERIKRYVRHSYYTHAILYILMGVLMASIAWEVSSDFMHFFRIAGITCGLYWIGKFIVFIIFKIMEFDYDPE